MYRGTTPTYEVELAIDIADVKKVRFVFKQGDTVLKKDIDGTELTDNTVSVKLSQEETFMFDECKCATVQVRVLTKGDDALITDPYPVHIGPCSDTEVLE